MAETQDSGFHLVSEITKGDYRSAVYFNVYMKKKTILPFLLVGVIVAAFRVLGRVLGFLPQGDLFFYICGIYLCFVVAMLAICEWQIQRFEAQFKAVGAQSQKLCIDERGVSDESDGLEEPVLFPWDGVLEAYEIKGLFILFVTQHRAILIPKGSLSDQEKSHVRKTLSEKLTVRFSQRCS